MTTRLSPACDGVEAIGPDAKCTLRCTLNNDIASNP